MKTIQEIAQEVLDSKDKKRLFSLLWELFDVRYRDYVAANADDMLKDAIRKSADKFVHTFDGKEYSASISFDDKHEPGESSGTDDCEVFFRATLKALINLSEVSPDNDRELQKHMLEHALSNAVDERDRTLKLLEEAIHDRDAAKEEVKRLRQKIEKMPDEFIEGTDIYGWKRVADELKLKAYHYGGTAEQWYMGFEKERKASEAAHKELKELKATIDTMRSILRNLEERVDRERLNTTAYADDLRDVASQTRKLRQTLDSMDEKGRV